MILCYYPYHESGIHFIKFEIITVEFRLNRIPRGLPHHVFFNSVTAALFSTPEKQICLETHGFLFRQRRVSHSHWCCHIYLSVSSLNESSKTGSLYSQSSTGGHLNLTPLHFLSPLKLLCYNGSSCVLGAPRALLIMKVTPTNPTVLDYFVNYLD